VSIRLDLGCQRYCRVLYPDSSDGNILYNYSVVITTKELIKLSWLETVLLTKLQPFYVSPGFPLASFFHLRVQSQIPHCI
jgi:hypothetical protein